MNRAIMDLESTKRNKKLVRSFFEEKTISFAAAQVVSLGFTYLAFGVLLSATDRGYALTIRIQVL
ncbi:hypothetical protein MNBD_GAMMA21-2800 [hydrothermal vent metagenome]|uniref:Uncharacterized protein n=1 Tax=hydrothermal vent metagenome TaxID=652676 RepID=A0A3B1AGP6_9ZZZZ